MPTSGVLRSDRDGIPACNLHSFIFSNPFGLSSPIVGKVNAETGFVNATYPPIPPHKLIFHDPSLSVTLTYERLRRDTLRLAHGIHQRYGTPIVSDAFGSGSQAGPVVLLHLPNCVCWPVIALGFLAAGWTVTGTNPGNTPNELAHTIKQCEPRVVVCNPGTGGEHNVRAACADVGYGDNLEYFFVDPSEDFYDLRRKDVGEQSWASLLSTSELNVAPLSADEADHRLAFIQWTSGTTGKPKGAMMTHRGMVAIMIQVWSSYPGFSADERWIAVTPLYHAFALNCQTLFAPCVGATVIIVAKFDLRNYLELITSHEVTHLHIVPPMALALAKSNLINEPWCSLSSVKNAMVSGAPIAPDLIRELWKRTRICLQLVYGMTEVAGISAFKSGKWEDIEPYLGTSGSPVYRSKITIVGEDGNPVRDKRLGEIVVQTPCRMLGYIKDQQATAEAITQYGVHTGDLGYFYDGYLRISGRLKELIKYKGYQVSPSELEAVISAIPEIQDVAVSSVYSNVEATELPLAYIVPHHTPPAATTTPVVGGEEDSVVPKEFLALAEAVKTIVEKNCVHYKRLRGGIIFTSAIPKTPSGKILRRSLKNQTGLHVQCYPVTTTMSQSKL